MYFCKVINFTKRMKRILVILGLVSVIVVSCDYGHSFYIANKTTDTIIIVSANYNSIDSAIYFLPRGGSKYDSTWTEFNGKGKLQLSEINLIPSDSTACYAVFNAPFFYDSQDQKGYFYIIKLENAKKYTWGEICRDTLYNKLVITQEMIEQVKTQESSPVIQWNNRNDGSDV